MNKLSIEPKKIKYLLNDGEQQLAPSGEISVLPINIQELDENSSYDLHKSE